MDEAPQSEAAIKALADAFFAAIERGDVDAAGACYHEDVQVWHSYDGLVQTRDENVKVLKFLSRAIKGLRYEEVERDYFKAGFVQRHMLMGEVRGVALRAPVCFVVHLLEGRIHRVYEYIAAADIRPLLPA